MRALEDALLEIESALNPASKVPARAMSEYQDDIPESAKDAIRKKLEEIRKEIGDARDCYGLYADAISNRRRLSTRLSILAIDLTECRPQYLRGYGEVPDEEQGPLDERMSRLEAMLSALNRLLISAD